MIEIRLRRSLHVKSRQTREMEAMLGYELPATIIPARTTLRVVDLFVNGALCLTPDGQRLLVGVETCRDYAYVPRPRAQAATGSIS